MVGLPKSEFRAMSNVLLNHSGVGSNVTENRELCGAGWVVSDTSSACGLQCSTASPHKPLCYNAHTEFTGNLLLLFLY